MSLIQKYKALPRSTRWAALAGVALILYFGIIERMLDWSNAQRAEAAQIQKSLADRAKLAQEQETSGGKLERSIVAFGAPHAPANMSDPEDTLSRKVESLARKHEVTIKRRQPSRTPATNLDWNGQKVDRVQLSVTIECNALQFVAILKELEASPEIAAVNSVRMQKMSEPNMSLADSSLMQITLVPEVWVYARGAGSPPPPAPAPHAEPAPEPVPETVTEPDLIPQPEEKP